MRGGNMLAVKGTTSLQLSNMLKTNYFELNAPILSALALSQAASKSLGLAQIPVLQNNLESTTFQYSADQYFSGRLNTINWNSSSWASQYLIFGPIPRPKQLEVKGKYIRENGKCSYFKIWAWNLNKSTKYLLYAYGDRNGALQVASNSGIFYNENATIPKQTIYSGTTPRYQDYTLDLTTFDKCFTANEQQVYLSIESPLVIKGVDGVATWNTYPYWLNHLKVTW